MTTNPRTIDDFKHHIAIIRREIETGKKYSVIGAARPHESLVRQNRPKIRCKKCGAVKSATGAWCPNYRRHRR